MSSLSVPTRYGLLEAEAIALAIVERLAPFCERLAIAGSIRRRVAEVKDVELLAIPARRQQQPGLFEDLPVTVKAPPVDELDEALGEMLGDLVVRKRPDRRGRTFWGPSDKRILWRYGVGHADWIPVDLFGASFETWGAKLALRTGPWELSKRLVTPRAQGGLMPDDLQFTKGGLYRFDTQTNARFRTFVPTPDEATLFRELGLPYVAPERRFDSTFRAGSGRR